MLEESVECFVRQDYQDKELIILNDTPNQHLVVNNPQVKVINTDERFPNLGLKLRALIQASQGDLICRWDDDDISLPHRLSYSVEKMSEHLEWHPTNYFWDVGELKYVDNPANIHVMSIFHRNILKQFEYPVVASGNEDQAFINEMSKAGLIINGETIPIEDIFYFYRWSTGAQHLSGFGAGEKMQSGYDKLGEEKIVTGKFEIKPRWYENHIERLEQQIRMSQTDYVCNGLKHINTSYFRFAGFYDYLLANMPRRATIVEVGCHHGTSLCYLAEKSKQMNMRHKIIGACAGKGVDGDDCLMDYATTPILLEHIRAKKLQDIITLIVTDSVRAAAMFANQSIDSVFIDDRHTYQAVRSSLQAWEPKVKFGGLVCGHDRVSMPEVLPAVQDYFGTDEGLAYPNDKDIWIKWKR